MANQITDNLAVLMENKGTYNIDPFPSEREAIDWIKANHLASLIIIADKDTLKHLLPLFGREIYPSKETIILQTGDEALLIRRVVTRSRMFGKSVSYFYALCRRLS